MVRLAAATHWATDAAVHGGPIAVKLAEAVACTCTLEDSRTDVSRLEAASAAALTPAARRIAVVAAALALAAEVRAAAREIEVVSAALELEMVTALDASA